jgi:dihydroorotate dehydrogenase
MRPYDLAKPILFRMDPEKAHSVGMFFLRFLGEQQQKNSDRSLSIKTSFGEIKNPFGLAAGLDKTGRYLSTLQKLGFGYLVGGTITLDPWPGNPKPRIVRNIKEKTLVNCLGFPNPGVQEFIANIKKKSKEMKVPVIASISGRTESSIIECYEKVQPYVSGIELNLSSPNTKNLKDLREPDAFNSLVRTLSSSKSKPTFLKVPPFHDAEQIVKNLDTIKIWKSAGFEGVTASNTIPIEDPRLSIGSGGYSGPPLFDYTTKAIQEIRKVALNDFEINSVGGISKATDAKLALSQGATTVQLYTSLIYEGPGLIKRILNELQEGKEKKEEEITKTV